MMNSIRIHRIISSSSSGQIPPHLLVPTSTIHRQSNSRTFSHVNNRRLPSVQSLYTSPRFLFRRTLCSHQKEFLTEGEGLADIVTASDDGKNPFEKDHSGSHKSVEDALFQMFQESSDSNNISIGKFLATLNSAGIRKTDPRLRETMDKLRKIWQDSKTRIGSMEGMNVDRDNFRNIVRDNIVLVSRALRHQFIIPDFEGFCRHIEDFYWKCKDNTIGKCADYIPQLAKVDPSHWGVSLCTVDGQRYSIGDTESPFTIQSSGKPINYAIALNQLGQDVVHSFVGQEPSGRMFNELVLDHNRHPHNPMVNAGAIVICSLLLYMVEPDMFMSEKFDWMCSQYKSMSGGEFLGFSNATFLSEREAADRNYSIAYFMKEHKCFPKNSSLKDIMDFYFQMCSLEVNCETVSVMAATLANGGICPITSEKVLSSQAVRDVLSLMHSCGMYDYSGQFAFNIGLPAKSGVSGCLAVVVPNVMGIATWSPPLDSFGNSVRGVQFCRELVTTYNFHQYDNLRHVPHKKDPRRLKFETQGLKVVSLLFSAASGDVSALRRAFLSGMDMNLRDYDGRTALHLAASEGHLEAVDFLVKVCSVDAGPRDRWGHNPLDEAKISNRREVVEYLEKLKVVRMSPSKTTSSSDASKDEPTTSTLQSVTLSSQTYHPSTDKDKDEK